MLCPLISHVDLMFFPEHGAKVLTSEVEVVLALVSPDQVKSPVLMFKRKRNKKKFKTAFILRRNNQLFS